MICTQDEQNRDLADALLSSVENSMMENPFCLFRDDSVTLPCARRTDHARPLLWHELVAITQADVTHMISYTSLEAWCPRRRVVSERVSQTKCSLHR